MIKIYKTEESIVNEIEKVEDGCWINMITPTMEECINISEQFDIDIADVRAALDDEESSQSDPCITVIICNACYLKCTFSLRNRIFRQEAGKLFS